jgi:hypothetical protein
MGLRSMATETEQTERAEPDVETTMDGGLCRLDTPGVAALEDDEVVTPRRARDDD